MIVGMDFGTTNSGMAVYNGRSVQLLPLDPANAKATLGWEAKLGLKEMCEDTWRWQSGNPNGYVK